MATEVDAVVFRETVAVPDAEAGKGGETALAGGRIDRIRAEPERNVLVADVRCVGVQSEPWIDLPRIAERDLIGVGVASVGDATSFGGLTAVPPRADSAAAAGQAGRRCRWRS